MINKARYGLGFVGRGAGFLVRRPALFPWAVVPVLITIGMVIWAWFQSWSWTPWLLNLVWARPEPGMLQNLWNGVALLLVLWVFATTAILLYGLIGAFGAPFYDRMSLAVELEVRGSVAELTWQEEVWAVIRSITHSLLSAWIWVFVMVALLLLELIPVVGTLLELGASVFFTSLFLAREMLDGPTARRGWTYREKIDFVREHQAVMVGFGLGAAALFLIPLVNFVTIPICVVGGTLLFLELEAPLE